MKTHTCKITIIVSLVSATFLSISFLLMPIGNYASFFDKRWYEIIIGLLFWTSTICLLTTQILLLKRHKVSNKCKRIGIISAFKNLYATVIDIVFMLSIIFLIFTTIFVDQTKYVNYVAIALFVFALNFHCILNGKHFNSMLTEEDNKNE